MHWLQTLDIELFRFINSALINPVFDAAMPFISGTNLSEKLFLSLAVAAGFLVVWKGRTRGLLCLLMAGLAVGVADGLICRTIKHAVARPRPYVTLAAVHRPDLNGASANKPSPNSPGRPPSRPRADFTSMPSSHAANWFAATMMAFLYYRRSVCFMLPMATLVAFSRVYNGVHYPSDVLAGAILGAGSAAATLWLLHGLWQWLGRKWFPLWWEKLPSLCPTAGDVNVRTPMSVPPVTVDTHWLRLGFGLIVILLVARLIYILGGTIELSEDEAYQWLWSKHLALSYYSKPPLLAYTQYLSTSLWGDTAFGIRFFSPVITAVLSLAMLRFFAREVNARAGFFLLLILTATPLISPGAVLMTVDPLSVLFWVMAMLAGWRAVQPNARTTVWLWVGLWMGLGFLSKYTALFQWLCWAVFFVVWPPARAHLRRPGPWLALLANQACALPVLVWNWQHDWVTVTHVGQSAGVGTPWEPTLKFFWEFLGTEFGLLNPVFFVAMVWAAVKLWRHRVRDARLIFFFSMGAPLFLSYLLCSFRCQIQPNWIAPSVVPLFCMMVIYWDSEWRTRAAWIKGWLATGLVLGFAAVILTHNTDLTKKLTGHFLPVNQDPLHRVRLWSEVARVVGQARREMEAEGKPAFIITDHYGLAALISFYLPEARARVSDTPLVYFRTSPIPLNQFYFWPGYSGRKGENAIYVRELDRNKPQAGPPRASIQGEFETVTNLGVSNVMYHAQVCRPLQFFACRGLR